VEIPAVNSLDSALNMPVVDASRSIASLTTLTENGQDRRRQRVVVRSIDR
jgi:hypothetical protein